MSCHSRKHYPRKRAVRRPEIRFLSEYLLQEAGHLYEPFRAVIRQHHGNAIKTRLMLRKLIGEEHWKRAESFRYHHAIKARGKEQTIFRSPWPILCELLNCDVTGHIFSFLDDESICTATKVSKSFHACLEPHRQNISISGFKTYEAFRRRKYDRMVFFSGRNSELVTDQVLLSLADTSLGYPDFSRIDIRGCNTTLEGVADFLYAMGSRLEGLSMSHSHEIAVDAESMRRIETLLSQKCSSLVSLSLELNHPWTKEFRPSCLDNHGSLQELSLTLDDRMYLPVSLPNLEVLKLEIIDDYVECYWRLLLVRSQYPKLKWLEVTITSYAFLPLVLRIDLLISAIKAKLPSLEYLVVKRAKRTSPLDKYRDYKRTATRDDIRRARYRRREDETNEWKRLRAFAKSRNIKCKCPLL